MAATIISGLLPLSAEAQTPPQPLTPQTTPAYPYQQPPAAQGYPYSYYYPYYSPYWAYGYPWGWGYPWGVGMAYRSFGRVWRLL